MTRRSCTIALLVATAALAAPPAAGAATETFHRFEAEATANYTVVQQCAGGSATQWRVTVIGGHEQESEDGAVTLDNEFLTVRLQGFDCAGEFVSDSGFAAAQFHYSPSLQRASAVGTVTTRGGRSVTADVGWDGTGPMQTTSNVTHFPGFTGHFTGKVRDAVATGTVVVDGETLVDGSTTNARIETLEDKNVSQP